MGSPISDGLASVPTGPKLVARLAKTEPRAVSDPELLELLSAQARQLSYQQAQVWEVMAEIAVRDPSPNLSSGTAWTQAQIFDSAVDEIRAELCLTRRGAERELAHAAAV